MVDDKPDEKERRKDAKLSMHPLPLEEALGAALKVKPKSKPKSSRPKRKGAPNL